MAAHVHEHLKNGAEIRVTFSTGNGPDREFEDLNLSSFAQWIAGHYRMQSERQPMHPAEPAYSFTTNIMQRVAPEHSFAHGIAFSPDQK
jgi:hypothetical protein